MNKYILFLEIIILSLSCNQPNSKNIPNAEMHAKIDSIRQHNNIPAIGYGVVWRNSVLLQRVTGVRNIQTGEKAELNDLFNLASNTKSFVAFMAAKQVESGTVHWDTRFFDVFPELRAGSHPGYAAITLQDLLSHRARLIRFQKESEIYPIQDYEKLYGDTLSRTQKRYYFVKQALTYEPIPLYSHEDNRYSNAGYIAAALMLEKVCGKSWPELLQQLNQDLEIYCHDGWPDTYAPHQPRGHLRPRDWQIDMPDELLPIPEALRQYHYFNQLYQLVAPISISVPDFLKFLSLHIQGLRGQDNYLHAETYDYLFNYQPDYALGWSRYLFGKQFYHHRGGIATFCSIALINPATEIGIVVLYNTHTNAGMDDIVRLLDDEFSVASLSVY